MCKADKNSDLRNPAGKGLKIVEKNLKNVKSERVEGLSG